MITISSSVALTLETRKCPNSSTTSPLPTDGLVPVWWTWRCGGTLLVLLVWLELSERTCFHPWRTQVLGSVTHQRNKTAFSRNILWLILGVGWITDQKFNVHLLGQPELRAFFMSLKEKTDSSPLDSWTVSLTSKRQVTVCVFPDRRHNKSFTFLLIH